LSCLYSFPTRRSSDLLLVQNLLVYYFRHIESRMLRKPKNNKNKQASGREVRQELYLNHEIRKKPQQDVGAFFCYFFFCALLYLSLLNSSELKLQHCKNRLVVKLKILTFFGNSNHGKKGPLYYIQSRY